MVSVRDNGRSPQVGIVSLFGMYNFGNRLQGYAVDSLLRESGAHPTTIVFQRKLGISRIKDKVYRPVVDRRGPYNSARRRRFQEFVRPQLFKHIVIPQEIPRLSKSFDLFVVGSDQVWHPKADLYPGTQFLQFAAPGQRVALAPSLGVETLPAREIERYRRGLDGFSQLSVREERAADLIEEIRGERPRVLPDPTIGVGREAWSAVASTGCRPADPFVLVNFLGGCSAETWATVHRLAERLKARVVDLGDPNATFWAAGPQDFLSMVQGARLVLTDSFHTCVFASIFEVPFYVFQRQEGESTYSRVVNLLKTLALSGRESVDIDHSGVLNQDYSGVRAHLADQRERLTSFVAGSVQGL